MRGEKVAQATEPKQETGHQRVQRLMRDVPPVNSTRDDIGATTGHEIAGSKRLLDSVFQVRIANMSAPGPNVYNEPHSSDIWATARALNVLRESRYSYDDSPVIDRALSDAARFLGEFGNIREKAESRSRFDYQSAVTWQAAEDARRHVLNSPEYIEGVRSFKERAARKLRTETRKPKAKAGK